MYAMGGGGGGGGGWDGGGGVGCNPCDVMAFEGLSFASVDHNSIAILKRTGVSNAINPSEGKGERHAVCYRGANNPMASVVQDDMTPLPPIDHVCFGFFKVKIYNCRDS